MGRPLSIISDTDGIGEATAGGRSMELRPKARKKDVEMSIESCRTKFGCFETGGPGEDLAGEYMINIVIPLHPLPPEKLPLLIFSLFS